jgi:hypothetical protein
MENCAIEEPPKTDASGSNGRFKLSVEDEAALGGLLKTKASH